MPARIVQLCDDVVSHLNSLSLSQSFTAVRHNVWFSDLTDTNALQVVVVPQDTETQVETRQASSRKFRVLVIIQQRLTTGDDRTEQDELLLLSEEIEDELYGVAMGDFGFDTFSDTVGSRQVIELESVAGHRTFRTVLQVAYLGA